MEDGRTDVLIDDGQLAWGQGNEDQYDRYGDFYHFI